MLKGHSVLPPLILALGATQKLRLWLVTAPSLLEIPVSFIISTLGAGCFCLRILLELIFCFHHEYFFLFMPYFFWDEGRTPMLFSNDIFTSSTNILPPIFLSFCYHQVSAFRAEFHLRDTSIRARSSLGHPR